MTLNESEISNQTINNNAKYLHVDQEAWHNTSARQLQYDGNVDQGAPQYSYKATSVHNIARGIWKAMVLLGTAELIQNYTWVPDFNQ